MFNNSFCYNLHARTLHQQQFIEPPEPSFSDGKAEDTMETWMESVNKSAPIYFNPVP